MKHSSECEWSMNLAKQRLERATNSLYTLPSELRGPKEVVEKNGKSAKRTTNLVERSLGRGDTSPCTAPHSARKVLQNAKHIVRSRFQGEFKSKSSTRRKRKASYQNALCALRENTQNSLNNNGVLATPPSFIVVVVEAFSQEKFITTYIDVLSDSFSKCPIDIFLSLQEKTLTGRILCKDGHCSSLGTTKRRLSKRLSPRSILERKSARERASSVKEKEFIKRLLESAVNQK
ncbi:hypothetical protein RND71_037538 [Anisodus tanguticus]|uniref:Uncharacterized protein n=1 Tax=Anisodus tanguticus TaxID=243964 RepID=A0AAE1R2I3_9SOLA|nr:hypothetical protein RND71_037538 [Anisodus tanguticus]